MARCKKAWLGQDSKGRTVEVAQSESGKFFARVSDFMGTSAWSEHAPEWINATHNQYNGEITEHADGEVMAWGFRRMEAYKETPRFRLPK